MSNLTKGPWKLYRLPNGMWSIGASDNHPSHPEYEVARFNADKDVARLIAAAPDMLKALRHATNLIADIQQNGCPAGPTAIPSIINDALARAS